MLLLTVMSAAARLALCIVIARLLMRLGHILNAAERIGAGLMGGSGLMTVPVILDVHSDGTPFDVWAGVVFTIGGLMFFSGFMHRKLGHERKNEEAVEAARQHFATRGH